MPKKKKRKIDSLPPKYKEFLLNYISLGKHGRKAYMLTYPKTKPHTADTMASRLLKKVKVSEALQEYLDGIFIEKEKEISKMFDNLLDIANSDISDYIDEDGNIKVEEFDKLNTYVLAQYDKTVNETDSSRNVKQSIKMLDKLKAISELVKILGMVQEKVEVSVNFDKESVKDIQDIFGEQIISKKGS